MRRTVRRLRPAVLPAAVIAMWFATRAYDGRTESIRADIETTFDPVASFDHLLATPTPAMRFDRVPPGDALARLSRECGVPIDFDIAVLAAIPFHSDARLTLELPPAKLEIAIRRVLRAIGDVPLVASIDLKDPRRLRVISSVDESKVLVTCIYDVRGLLGRMLAREHRLTDAQFTDHDFTGAVAPEFVFYSRTPRPLPLQTAIEENLKSQIVDSVASDTWRENGGTSGWIGVIDGRLIVTQTIGNQREVRGLLAGLP